LYIRSYSVSVLCIYRSVNIFIFQPVEPIGKVM
jgi:hypothetical protein